LEKLKRLMSSEICGSLQHGMDVILLVGFPRLESAELLNA
jgi:hypothetical protein